MDEEPIHLSLSEVRRALDRLRSADVLRLTLLARHWAGGLGQRDPDDLLNEAFDRILSGRRPWPSEISLPAFFSGVMRSIASEWRYKTRREALIDDDCDSAAEQVEDVQSVDHERTDLLRRMRGVLQDDPDAAGVLEHMLADTRRAEAQAVLGLDATAYDTARRRMIRRIAATFNPGWKP